MKTYLGKGENKMKKLYKSTTALAMMASVLVAPAFAQEVRLIGKDSNINVVGRLLSLREGKYLVETEIGEFIINQELVTCEGDACPTGLDLTFDLNIAASGGLAEILVPILADGYAAFSLEAEAELLDANGKVIDTESADGEGGMESEFAIRLTDYEGEVVGSFGVSKADGDGLFELLAGNEAAVAFTYSPALKANRASVADGGGGNLRAYEQEHVIAVDGYAMVVNPLNNIPYLTLDQATRIFTGDITNWSEVGGSNAPINLYSIDPDSYAFDRVSSLLFPRGSGSVKEELSIMRSQRELATAITNDVAGFGIVDFASKRDTRALPLKSVCGIVQAPTLFNLKAEEYELHTRVKAYNRSDIEGFGREFVDYLDGPQLDGLVAKAGYINLSVVTGSQEESIERLAAELEEGENEFEAGLVEELLKRMNTYDRLSTSFRFAPGSQRMDNKARRDMARMLSYLAENKPSELIVIGFTDNKGAYDPNLLISQERAEGVMKQLVAAATDGQLDDIAMTAEGFGELAPVACNSSSGGRATNRRVEIWVKS